MLLGPGLGWLALFLVVPCAIVFVYSFFERGTYGGIDYVFTLENYARAVDPLYLVDLADLGPDRGADHAGGAGDRLSGRLSDRDRAEIAGRCRC